MRFIRRVQTEEVTLMTDETFLPLETLHPDAENQFMGTIKNTNKIQFMRPYVGKVLQSLLRSVQRTETPLSAVMSPVGIISRRPLSLTTKLSIQLSSIVTADKPEAI